MQKIQFDAIYESAYNKVYELSELIISISLRCFAGYSCTRFTVGSAWVRKRLPQESRWTLASVGETKS